MRGLRLRRDQRITRRVVRNARRKGVKVYTRRQWGTKYPNVYKDRHTTRHHFLLPKAPADTLVHHITVTLDHGPLTRQFFVDVQTIERIGMERFGSGTSYNWLIDMQTGEVALGQDLEAKGTHTVNDKNVPGYSQDQNGVALAIAFLGMPGDKLTRKAVRSWILLVAAHIEEKALTPTFDADPHSKFAYKDCPTDAVRDLIPQVKRQALRIVSSSEK